MDVSTEPPTDRRVKEVTGTTVQNIPKIELVRRRELGTPTVQHHVREACFAGRGVRLDDHWQW